MPRLPLEGVRIADFTWVVAGPHSMRIMADMGAEVIKIERHPVNPMFARTRNSFQGNLNRNKRSITLNLANPEGVELAKRIIAKSDAVVENFSARVMRNFGLDYDNLVKIKPDIIMVSMAGMGHTGPNREYVTYGPTLQALSGFTLLTGFPDQDPVGFGYSYADMAGGYTAALAVITALWNKRRTGQGQFIDLSQFEGVCSLIGPAFLDYTVNGTVPTRRGNRSPDRPAAPHAAYRCAGEDRWCVISVFTEEEWQAFSKAIGNPSWTKDPKFQNLASRVQNENELDGLVEKWTIEKSAEEVMSIMQGAGIAAGVVQSGEDLYHHDPQLKARGFWVTTGDEKTGKVPVEGIPFKLSETPGSIRKPASLVGEDNDYVLSHILEIDAEEISRLKEQGIV